MRSCWILPFVRRCGGVRTGCKIGITGSFRDGTGFLWEDVYPGKLENGLRLQKNCSGNSADKEETEPKKLIIMSVRRLSQVRLNWESTEWCSFTAAFQLWKEEQRDISFLAAAFKSSLSLQHPSQ
ncbi:hypothetical protein SRHO_G00283840 [Serrasalmus rhombeus]